MSDASASGPNASERLLTVNRFVGLVFCLLISWSIWTGILAFYADFVRPWMMPEVARAAVLSAGDTPPSASRTYARVAELHVVGTRWTMMAPNDLRPFFIFSGRIVAKGGPAGVTPPLSNLMVHPDTGLMAPWNGSLADGLFRRIHTDLLLPKPWGRLLMGIAGVLIVMLTVGGLFIHGKMIRDAVAEPERRAQAVRVLADPLPPAARADRGGPWHEGGERSDRSDPVERRRRARRPDPRQRTGGGRHAARPPRSPATPCRPGSTAACGAFSTASPTPGLAACAATRES